MRTCSDEAEKSRRPSINMRQEYILITVNNICVQTEESELVRLNDGLEKVIKCKLWGSKIINKSSFYLIL